MYVMELNREQVISLKCAYLCELANCGEYREVTGLDRDEPSWGDMADSDSLIDDSIVFEHYQCVEFSDDDF